MIGAGEYLVVFASGKNRVEPGAPLHTDFQLNREGEYLALVDSNDSIISQFAPEYPSQRSGISYGTYVETPQEKLIATGAAAQLLVPQSEAQYDANWVDPAFVPGALWQDVTLGVGYDTEIDNSAQFLSAMESV